MPSSIASQLVHTKTDGLARPARIERAVALKLSSPTMTAPPAGQGPRSGSKGCFCAGVMDGSFWSVVCVWETKHDQTHDLHLPPRPAGMGSCVEESMSKTSLPIAEVVARRWCLSSHGSFPSRSFRTVWSATPKRLLPHHSDTSIREAPSARWQILQMACFVWASRCKDHVSTIFEKRKSSSTDVGRL